MLVTLEQFLRVLLDPSLCDRCHGQSYEKVAWTFFFQRRRRRTCCKCALKHACVVCVGHLVFPSWFARSKKNVRSCTLPGSRPPLHVGLPGLIVNWNSWREAREEWSRMSDGSCTLCSRWLLSTHHHHLAMAASKEKKPSVEHPTATQLSDEQALQISKDALKSACLLQLCSNVVGRWTRRMSTRLCFRAPGRISSGLCWHQRQMMGARYQGLFAVGNIQLCFCIQ